MSMLMQILKDQVNTSCKDVKENTTENSRAKANFAVPKLLLSRKPSTSYTDSIFRMCNFKGQVAAKAHLQSLLGHVDFILNN